jgi:hypothetical protein
MKSYENVARPNPMRGFHALGVKFSRIPDKKQIQSSIT